MPVMAALQAAVSCLYGEMSALCHIAPLITLSEYTFMIQQQNFGSGYIFSFFHLKLVLLGKNSQPFKLVLKNTKLVFVKKQFGIKLDHMIWLLVSSRSVSGFGQVFTLLAFLLKLFKLVIIIYFEILGAFGLVSICVTHPFFHVCVYVTTTCKYKIQLNCL